jgi:hypothetical protein
VDVLRASSMKVLPWSNYLQLAVDSSSLPAMIIYHGLPLRCSSVDEVEYYSWGDLQLHLVEAVALPQIFFT